MKHRYTFSLLLLALLLVSALAMSSLPRSASAQRQSGMTATSEQLTDSAKAQIAALIAEKDSRTPAQQKIDSKVLQAIRENRGQTMAPGVDSLRTADIGQTDGWVILDIRATINDHLLNALMKERADIINAFPAFDSARIRMPLERIESIAELSEVKFISRELTYDLNRMETQDRRQSVAQPGTQADARNGFEQRAANVRRMLSSYATRGQDNDPVLDTGTVNSQGDRTHRADEARAVYGHQGEGIKVGVISDSYNFLGVAQNDVFSGNLPGVGNPNGHTTPVTVIEDSGSSDEGRAMMQIVHDVVPRAQLYFATANGGPANFANNILQLQAAGCTVIIDDVSYFNESPFQSGPVGIAVETVTAAGTLYFASAGNAGSVLKNTGGVWEGDYNDNGGTSALTIPGNTKTGTVHDFNPGAPVQQTNVVNAGSTRPYTLFWSDPLGASTNDYDLFILDAALTTVFDSSTTTQSGTQDPYEETAGAVFAADRVVVFKTNTAAVRAIHVNTNRGVLATPTTGQTHSHSATVAAAFNMAAAPAVGPFPNPFSGTSLLETFSSDGPRRVFYNSLGVPYTPANLLFSTNGGTVLSKPDLTAADGVATTFPANSGLNPFFGTSASSPHAGAIAALIRSANPSLTASQIRTILENNAVDVEGAGPDINSGKGIIQAFQSVGAALATPSAGLSLGTVTVTEGSPSNGNGIPEPGDAVNVVVQLTNPSSTTATSVEATLGPAAPDQGTSGFGSSTSTFGPITYGNITPSSSASNTGTPFRLTMGRFLACNAAVPVVMVVNLGGGSSPISFNFNLQLGGSITNVAGLNLATTLDATAPPSGAGYTATTGTQTGRLNRNGATPSCSAQKATPALQDSTTGRKYDAYTLTNSNANPVCYTITVTPSCTPSTMYSVTYGSGGFVPTAIQTNYRADSGVANALPPYSVVIPAGQAFTVVVHEITPGAAACAYTIDVSGVTVPTCAAPFVPRISNFGNDNKSDIGVWRPTDGNWYVRDSTTGFVTAANWGLNGDKPVPGDYDGDAKTDKAVYRPSEGNWYITRSGGLSGPSVIGWGTSTDIPVQGDYDGDNKTDMAVFRPSEGNWYITRSGGGGARIQNWGLSGDKPVPADYDGDGRTDVAVFRPSNGNWYIIKSSSGTKTQGWGISTDVPVPADYDGDRIADIAIYRPTEGNWYIIKSGSGGSVQGWGLSTDKPVPADYDGDGKADIAVYRASEGNWYIIQSTGGGILLNLGIAQQPQDVPIPSAYIP